MLPRWLLLCWCSVMLGGEAALPGQTVLDASNQETLSTDLNLEANPEGRAACQKLLDRFPDLVSFPGDNVYEKEQSNYWSIRQAVARPACRLTPRTTHETSQLIQHLNNHDIEVAVVSGGHSTIPGATNLHAGITLDLLAVRDIFIAKDNLTVTFGPGTRWIDLYDLLGVYGLTIAGARAGTVGAGGFLLGGGISILAPSKGWSCDNLISVEVTLGNGTIVTADANHHTDLFTSMKGAGPNFGIATSFTMNVVPFTQLQSSVIQYSGEQFKDLAREIVNFAKYNHDDPDAAIDLSVIADPSGSFLTSFLMATRFGEIKESKTLPRFYDIDHFLGYINNVSPSQAADIVDISNPRGSRHSRCTLTIRNDENTLLSIFAAIENEFLRKDLPGGISYLPAMLVQPIYRTQLGGKNALGLDEDTEPLLLISLEATWSLSKHDTLIPDHLTTIRLLLTEIARRHNALHPFVYPNYAGADQDVFAAVKNLEGEGSMGVKEGEEKMKMSMEWLRGVQREYDGDEYVKRRIVGPFKL